MITSILLAEDNLEHCFFFRKALQEIAPDIQFSEVHDGDKLIALLESYLPDLLFLDLSMPCKNGVQCIQEIRENRIYDSLPIVVFTVSSQHNSIQASYGFGANLYMIKPESYELLVSSLKAILSMNWNDAKSITEKHFESNKYMPFQLPT
jgi:DNA-binding response OmpR family regulator